MRISRTFLAIFSLLLTTSPAYALEIPETFNFQGTGYGHGVGLSQIGARGKALNGEDAHSILSYYYGATQIVSLADDQNIRVNVGHLLTQATLKSGTQGSVLNLYSGDVGEDLAAIPVATALFKSGILFTQQGSKISAYLVTGKNSQLIGTNSMWSTRWSGTRYLDGIPSTVSLKVNAKSVKYRYGQIQVKSVKAPIIGHRMEITNSVRIHDEYLFGIGEVPSSWPTQALIAQGIASRSYALSKLGIPKRACDCNVYNNISDQSFVGFSKETEAIYGPLWKAAVQASSTSENTGEVITLNNLPITAFFTSSSGGQTETSANAWGQERSFTSSVADPYSQDATLNPRYFTWIRSLTQPVLAKAFLLPDVVGLTINSRNSTGTVATITATSSDGKVATLRGETFRSRTQLPSAWFNLI
ncbi:MAG: SpoIID/LytB domain-containing protein [Candidatus Planktophila sp.]